MKQNYKLFAFIIIISNIFTGCNTIREVNDMSIATAIGINKNNEEYLVTAQILNVNEIAAEKRTRNTPITIYHTKGKTIIEALRKLTETVPKKIYVGHVRVVILGKELSEEGIKNSIDVFFRDHEFRSDMIFLVAKNSSPDEILKILTPGEIVQANKIYDSVQESAKTWANTKVTQLHEIVNSLTSDGNNLVVGAVNMRGSSEIGMEAENLEKVDPNALLQLNSLAAFKKDKLVGWLNKEESLGYNYIKGNVVSTIVNVFSETGEKTSIEILRTKSKIKGSIKNGKPKIDIILKVEANVEEVQENIDLTKVDNIHELEKRLEDKIKNDMETSIKVAKENFRSDIFGFGEAIHRSNNKQWKTLKANWDKEFVKLPVDIKVDAKLRYGTGKEIKPFYVKGKE